MAYPHIVQTAENVLHTLFGEFERNPYMFSRERDLQAEIGGRLQHALRLQGLGSVRGYFGRPAPKGQEQEWPRVGYEPYVGYDAAGIWKRMHPDVVIWDDAPYRGHEPDYDAGEQWPILWACEVKFGNPDGTATDKQKLERLIALRRITYGCVVSLTWDTSLLIPTTRWDQKDQARHLWVVDCRTPISLNERKER